MRAIATLLAAGLFLPQTARAAQDSEGGGFVGGLMYSLTDPVTHVAFLAFVVFLFILHRAGALRTVLGGLDKRADAIRAELEQAASYREQAAALLAEAQRRQNEAERDAEAIVAAAREDAKSMLEDARAQLAQRIARREAQAEARIARAEAEATDSVRRAAADAATEAARRILAAQAGPDQFEAAAREIERALS